MICTMTYSIGHCTACAILHTIAIAGSNDVPLHTAATATATSTIHEGLPTPPIRTSAKAYNNVRLPLLYVMQYQTFYTG